MRIKLKVGSCLILSALTLILTSSAPEANAQRYRERGYDRYDSYDSDYCDELARDYARNVGAFDGGVGRRALEGAIKGRIVGRALGGKRGARRGARAGAALGMIGGGMRKQQKRERVYRREYERCMRR